jgi:rhodanese-related sulfurtransferase
MKKPLIAAVLLALCGAAGATPQVSGDGACGIRAVDNESFVTCDGDRAPSPAGTGDVLAVAASPPAISIDAKRAWQIKRDLGAQVLLVDIRGRAEVFYTGMPIGADANVPLLEPSRDFAFDAADGQLLMELNTHFLERMDALLNARDLGRSDPVVLLCRSGERSSLAARLLREHGYRQLFVVSDGFEGRLSANADGSEVHRERGWKNAGLPWTARVDVRWLYSDAGR